jgi:2-methylcitrate dehydratase
MSDQYLVEELGAFVRDAQLSAMSGSARAALKRNILDSVGCALAAVDGEMVTVMRQQVSAVGGNPVSTLIGGGRTSADQAALLNSVLVRYVDLLDTYLTPGGLCHPADNFGAVLAVAEQVEASGADFMLALAIAYEVQCRFSAQVPVMARGLNHALQLAMSAAAGSAKLLGLDANQTAHAIAIAAADNVSLSPGETAFTRPWASGRSRRWRRASSTIAPGFIETDMVSAVPRRP